MVAGKNWSSVGENGGGGGGGVLPKNLQNGGPNKMGLVVKSRKTENDHPHPTPLYN